MRVVNSAVGVNVFFFKGLFSFFGFFLGVIWFSRAGFHESAGLCPRTSSYSSTQPLRARAGAPEVVLNGKPPRDRRPI